MLQDMQ
jgi:hypothetical protein